MMNAMILKEEILTDEELGYVSGGNIFAENIATFIPIPRDKVKV